MQCGYQLVDHPQGLYISFEKTYGRRFYYKAVPHYSSSPPPPSPFTALICVSP
jgi:hypothetical protein